MPANDDLNRRLIIQISDTHLVDRAVPHFHDVDAEANLVQALTMVVDSQLRPDIMVVTGDITDAGEEAAYQRARELIDGAASDLGCPVMYLPGNHDDRATFGTSMLGLPAPDASRAQLQQQTVGGLRVIGLDSVVPGESRGHLAAGLLEELASVLASPAERGSVIAMHHPPIRTPVPGIDAIGLDNPSQLAAALAGSDVRMILAGHAHHVTAGVLGAIPVWVGGGCIYWSHAMPPGHGGGTAGGQFSRIDVFADSAVATAIPLGPHRWVYEL